MLQQRKSSLTKTYGAVHLVLRQRNLAHDIPSFLRQWWEKGVSRVNNRDGLISVNMLSLGKINRKCIPFEAYLFYDSENDMLTPVR